MNGGEEEFGNSTCAVGTIQTTSLEWWREGEARSMRAVKDGLPTPYGEVEESEGGGPVDLLCSSNARSRTPLVGRAQWEIKQPPPLKRERVSLEGSSIPSLNSRSGTDRDSLSLSYGVQLSSSRGTTAMKNKPLIDTNPHLKVPAKYRKALIANVASSTAVETGASVESIARILAEQNKALPVKKTSGSAR